MSALLALLLASAAPAKQPMVSVDPATCNASRAVRVILRRLLQRPDRWRGRCASVTGLWSGRALYLEMEDAGEPGAEAFDGSRDRRLGIYAPDELVRLRGERPRLFQMVGVVLDCERLWDGSVFVSGYCHNNLSGPILVITEARRVR